MYCTMYYFMLSCAVKTLFLKKEKKIKKKKKDDKKKASVANLIELFWLYLPFAV